MKHIFLIAISFVFVCQTTWAYRPDMIFKQPTKKLKPRDGNCAPATKQIDLEINNVRSRLTNGGDVWWDGANGRYIVPKVEPGTGKREVSAIYAGSVWVGGFDPAGALKMMAQTFRSSTELDCWPGPLNPSNGEVTKEECIDWDRFFEVKGSNITEFKKRYNIAIAEGRTSLDISEIPEDVLYWPGRGNKHFSVKYNFELPDYKQGLGYFFDANQDGSYTPENGDYPVIQVTGCDEELYADQMFFWIFNDAGGVHTGSGGDPIRMEVQVQAFAFQTGDEINDMTFQRYKLINRAPQDIRDCYFAMWTDPDLGCSEDDYIGCDTAFEAIRIDGSIKNRDLMYIYNQDATDGSNGCNCTGGVATYCTDIPILGIDYFRGPLTKVIGKDINGQDSIYSQELGMSSFMYYNRGGLGAQPQTEDPNSAIEHYNYLTGKWKDGTRLTYGGSGYNPGSTNYTQYALSSSPNDALGWSMCTANLGQGDRRTLQATGPLLLGPGDLNELIIGATWVPDQEYPCPDISALLAADKLCQDLFDNCFKIKDGPTAPNVEFVELDRELIMILNNEIGSNNQNEKYEETGIGLPENVDDKYRFEGYRIFQVASPQTTLSNSTVDDPTKVREIFTVDLKNGIKKVYNWVGVKNPSPSTTRPIIYYPTEKVNGTNSGLRHTFQIVEDQFALGDRKLVNHKKYYFIVLAYGYNNYRAFNIDSPSLTQRIQYCPGRLNLGPNGDGKPYGATPRPQVYEKLNADYGDGVEITRLDGIGAGNNFLRVKPYMYDKILDGSFDGSIDYLAGSGPVQIKIYNPLKVQNGDYELRFVDLKNPTNNVLDSISWYLVRNQTDTVKAEGSFYTFSEQVVAKFGLSVTIGQTIEAGRDSLETCGIIGSGMETSYKDENGPSWFISQPDQNTPETDFIKNSLGQGFNKLDPKECWSNIGDGIYKGGWYPYFITSDTFGLTPRFVGANSTILKSELKDLNNVDIIFTSDKSKWSRCMVIETWNPRAGNQLNSPVSGLTSFQVKKYPSVGKEDSNNDGALDPDGSTGKDSTGLSWFPGYVVDVETGKRLNIFFGENSFYSPDPFFDGCNLQPLTGNDMTWNPTSEYFFSPFDFDCFIPADLRIILGGQHHIYVTKQAYDSCRQIKDKISQTSSGQRIQGFREITWTSMAALLPNVSMLPIKDGYIPNDFTVKLRVDNPYQWFEGTKENKGHPMYTFKIDGLEMNPVTDKTNFEEALDEVNVVPNPYYGFSSYESGQFSNVVKITNLPAKCEITIYSIDGKFIKQYKRDEVPRKVVGTFIGLTERQITPDVEWDLTNFKGIPVSSGAYLIHIKETSTGAEKIVKWFGVARKFDPSGL